MTRAPKQVASLVDLAVARSVRETGTLDAVPAAVALAGHSGFGEDALPCPGRRHQKAARESQPR